MSFVRQILSRKTSSPISVSPDTTVYDALQIMADNNIGSVIVMDNENYLGIMTERDYSRKVILNNKNSVNTLVSEIMSTDLPHVSPTNTVDECMEMMSDKNIRYLPVFDKNEMVGIVSMSDLVKQIISFQQQTITDLNNYIYSQ